MKIYTDNRLTLLLLIFMVIGAFVRLAGGHALIIPNLTYSGGTRLELPGTATPEDTATSFYVYINQGDYEKAWEISIEPNWVGESPASYKTAVHSSFSSFAGWTEEAAFTKRLTMELGKNGTWIKLNNIQAQRLENEEHDVALELLKTLKPEEVHSVRVKGHLLGACSIFQWEKDVLVITLGGEHKLLLEGTKKAKSFFYQSWLSNIKRIADLRKSNY